MQKKNPNNNRFYYILNENKKKIGKKSTQRLIYDFAICFYRLNAIFSNKIHINSPIFMQN
jgi:hypothetical protein